MPLGLPWDSKDRLCLLLLRSWLSRSETRQRLSLSLVNKPQPENAAPDSCKLLMGPETREHSKSAVAKAKAQLTGVRVEGVLVAFCATATGRQQAALSTSKAHKAATPWPQADKRLS